jgi:hypothetical protein
MLFPRAASDPIQLGPYTLTECIGQGGMAVVYKAKRQGPAGFEKTVVVKAMLPGLVAKKDLVDLFRNEARLSAQLSHPNIVQVHDFGVSDQVPYLVMEFLDGRNLTQLRGPLVPVSAGKLPVGAAIAIARDVCLALGYAHDYTGPDGTRQQIIHRDVSPSNVMVCRDGTVKLLDFGVAKVAGQFDCDVTQSFRGKYAYMAPEQVNRQPIDRRVDVFAAGIVLHEMLTGKRLFAAPSELETLERVSAAQVVAPSVDCPEIPRALDAIVKRALSRDPNQRFGSGAEMAEALEALDAHMYSRRKLARMLIDLFPDVYSVTCEVCGKSVPPGSECSECGTEIPLEGSDPFEPNHTDRNVVLPEMTSEPLPLPPPPPPKKKLELVRTPVPVFESPSFVEAMPPLPHDPGSGSFEAMPGNSASAPTLVDARPNVSRSVETQVDPTLKEPKLPPLKPVVKKPVLRMVSAKSRREDDDTKMGRRAATSPAIAATVPPPVPQVTPQMPPPPVIKPGAPDPAPMFKVATPPPAAPPLRTSGWPVTMDSLKAVPASSQGAVDSDSTPNLKPKSGGAATFIVSFILVAAIGGFGAAIMIRRAPPSYASEPPPIVVVPTPQATVLPTPPPVAKPAVVSAAPAPAPAIEKIEKAEKAVPPVEKVSRPRRHHRERAAVESDAPAAPTSTVREGRIVDPFAGSD